MDGERFRHPDLDLHVESWVDQADVLAEADAVVCHGGSGTTLAALGAGVPVVIVPLFADQFVNGQRVADAGAGVVVDNGPDRGGRRRPLSRDDAPRIAEAIETVRSRSSYASKRDASQPRWQSRRPPTSCSRD